MIDKQLKAMMDKKGIDTRETVYAVECPNRNDS